MTGLYQRTYYGAWCLFCFPLFLGKALQNTGFGAAVTLALFIVFVLVTCSLVIVFVLVTASVSPLVPTEQRMLLHTENMKNTITLSTLLAFIKSLE